jgi:hypothetical protein
MVLLHEIRDVKTEQIIVLAEGHDKFLGKDHDTLQFFGVPYYSLKFVESDKWFWGPSDARILEPYQIELCKVISEEAKHRMIQRVRYLYDKNKLDDDALSRFESTRLAAGVPVEGNPHEAIVTLQSHVSQDFTAQRQNIHGDSRDAIGVSQNQAGQFDAIGVSQNQAGQFAQGRHTAYEASEVKRGGDIRSNKRRSKMADFLVDVMEWEFESIFRFWKQPQVAQIVGPDGAMYWTEFTGEMLRGDYLYEIDAESGNPTSQEIRRQEAMQMLPVITQSLQTLMQLGEQSPQAQATLARMIELYPAILEYFVEQFPVKPMMRPGQNTVPMGQLNQQIEAQAGRAPQQAGGSPGGAISLPVRRTR